MLVNVGENLYRVQRPGDRPGKPTGAYYALLKRGGKQYRRALKTKDRKLAERRLADLRNVVERLTLSPDRNLTFEQIADRWLSVNGLALKPRSQHRRKTAIKAIKPFFRSAAIKNLTPADCERWVTERGPHIASQTFDHELSAMKGVFNYALQSGLILVNPAEHIKRCPIVTGRINVPTRAQFQELVAGIRQSDGRADSQRKAAAGADLVELLAYSGMRVGEATALLWRDVDFDRNTVTITGGIGGTKNQEIRAIPMTDALRALVLRLWAERKPTPDAHVSLVSSAKTAINKACKRLKLPHFHHHDFRHFFATTCIEAGVDIPTVSRWLGHKDGGALAMKVYGHLRQEHSFAQVERVSLAYAVPSQQPAPALMSPNQEPLNTY